MAPSKKSKKRKDPTTTKQKKGEDATRNLSSLLLVLVSILVLVASLLIPTLWKGSNESSKPALSFDDEPKEDMDAWDPPEPAVGFLVSRACQVIHCHDALRLVKRHFRATRRIEPGETLFDIPRSIQMWDLDALRDPFIRDNLFKASHKLSGNHVGTQALLAAYLALLPKRSDVPQSYTEVIKLAYLDMLPTLDDLAAYHPIFAPIEEMKEILGRSEAHSILQAYRNMFISEYQAFKDFSSEFGELVSRAEYYTARLNVLTRAVRVGPPGPEEVIKGPFLKNELGDEELLQDELEAYKSLLGIDLLEHGCIALVPIADLFNHHPLNSVEYEYKPQARNRNASFVVTAENRRIEEGFEPMANYGYMSDAHLFAKYGFVNGDGSGPTEVSLAFHHDLLRLNLSSQYDYLPKTGMTQKLYRYQEQPLAEYLRWDDGYGECIGGPNSHPEEAQLKRLKHQHLLRIANDYDKWVVLMPPRNPYSYPSTTHEIPITPDPPQYIHFHAKANFDSDGIRETCRLISLINSDLSGNAMQVLEDNIERESFRLGKQNDDLEFRSWLCMARWAGTRLLTLENQDLELRQEFDRISKLNRDSFGSRNWTAYHVRFGEMEALQAVTSLVFEHVDAKWPDKKESPPMEYTMRDLACPGENTDFLIEDTDDMFEVDL